MKDLIMIEEVPNWLNSKFINWNKMALIGKSVLDVIRAQSTPYEFEANTGLQSFFHTLVCFFLYKKYLSIT